MGCTPHLLSGEEGRVHPPGLIAQGLAIPVVAVLREHHQGLEGLGVLPDEARGVDVPRQRGESGMMLGIRTGSEPKHVVALA